MASDVEPRFNLKARHFQLTLNQPEHYDEIKDYLTKLKQFRYLISCKEYAPTTGKEHIHIYVQFSNPQRLSVKKCKGAHIEKCFGTPEQNKAYIEKGELIDEIGIFGSSEVTRFPSIDQVKLMSREERNQLPISYYNTVKRINTEEDNMMNIEDIYKPDVKVYYFYGPSGIGKSKNAVELIKKYGTKFDELKYENGFWLGYGGSEIAFYDDWRDSHMKASEFINFIDYYIHNLNVKGGCEKNRYKIIIITSIQSPWEIYQTQPELQEQWLRRMKICEVIDKDKYIIKASK